MATFVHIAPEAFAGAIRRRGIAVSRRAKDALPAKGVFCVPVVPDFFATHQWLRELRRWDGKTRRGIYFRVPDSQFVYAGHYNATHEQVTAAEAVAMAVDAPMGFEVIVPRAITQREIIRIKSLPHVTGWRVHPEAKGNEPIRFQSGSFGAKRLQIAIDERERREEARYYSRFPAEWYSDE